jgi:hypothetical protein
MDTLNMNVQFIIGNALVVVLLCSGIASSMACTEAIITDQCSEAVVSARTFSFATELSPQVTAGELQLSQLQLLLLLLLLLSMLHPLQLLFEAHDIKQQLNPMVCLQHHLKHHSPSLRSPTTGHQPSAPVCQ